MRDTLSSDEKFKKFAENFLKFGSFPVDGDLEDFQRAENIRSRAYFDVLPASTREFPSGQGYNSAYDNESYEFQSTIIV